MRSVLGEAEALGLRRSLQSLQTQQQEQRLQLALLSSRTAYLDDCHQALCDCLSTSGLLPAERLLARLHCLRFSAALRRHPFGYSESLESVAQAGGLMLSVAAGVGLEGTAALGAVSRTLCDGVAAAAEELDALFPVALYAVGGEAGGSALASVERYDATANAWSPCAPLQMPRSGCAAVALAGSIYVLGGCSVDGEDLSSVERLDPETGTWHFGPPMRAGRDELAATAAEGRLFALGGSHLVWPVRHVIDTVERFHPSDGTWECLPPLTRERCAAAAVAVGGRICVLGGCDEDGTALDTAEHFEIRVGAWHPLPPMLRPRCNFAASVVRGRVYVAGGYDDRMRDLDTVERFDPAVATWEALASLTIPRWGIRAAGRGGALFVVGGHTREEAVGAVDRLDPVSGLWLPLCNLGMARRSFGLAACYGG